MGDRGLHTSVWAAKRNGETQHTRPGDWTCPSCGFSNFQRRTECFRCSFTPAGADFKDDATERNGHRPPYVMPPPQDIHPLTSGLIENHTQHIPKVNSERTGLYTSRWAPRNSSGRPKVLDSGEVWIKVRLRSPVSGQ